MSDEKNEVARPKNAFFDVVRKPAFTEFNGEQVSLNKDVLMNADTGVVLGVVGKGYQMVKHATVADIVDAALANTVVKSMSDHMNGITNRWVREYVLGGDENTFDVTGKGDELNTKIRIFNGYDGRTSMGFEIAAWRKICTNGMMGWKKMHGDTFYHVDRGMVDNLRTSFGVQTAQFQDNIRIWEDWANIPFTKGQFEQFIKTREYLSEKQVEAILGLYDPTMNKYQEEETKWGNYNVLTAIATHHTKARQGSNIFSNAYKRMSKLAGEFFDWKPTAEKADGTDGKILIAVK